VEIKKARRQKAKEREVRKSIDDRQQTIEVERKKARRQKAKE
jgi:hypothetical protein